MDKYGCNLFYADEEKTLTLCKSIVKATEKFLTVTVKSQIICKKATEALETGDKYTKWTVLQKYIHKYPKLFTVTNGVQIKHVNDDFYSKTTEDAIAQQLKIVIGLIYFNEAKHCAEKETIKASLRKILEKSGVFSGSEIELLLS